MNGPRLTVHRIESRRLWPLLAGLFFLAACGSQSTSQASASALASASPSANVPAVAQPDYCKRVCDRATSCGNEQALRVKSLEPEAKAAVQKSAPDTTRICVEACMGEPTTPVRLSLADRCNQEKDCESFSKCLSTLGNELKK